MIYPIGMIGDYCLGGSGAEREESEMCLEGGSGGGREEPVVDGMCLEGEVVMRTGRLTLLLPYFKLHKHQKKVKFFVKLRSDQV